MFETNTITIALFDEWCKCLDEIALNKYEMNELTKETGKDCWYDYFISGATPENALLEDFSNF